MIRVLFWNTNRKDLSGQIASLCHEHMVDILILAEAGQGDAKLITALNTSSPKLYVQPRNLSDRLKFATSFPVNLVDVISDDRHYSVRHFRPPLGESLTIIAVHFPSKMFLDERDQFSVAQDVSKEVARVEEQLGHDRTVVIGDFNMNPFEFGLFASNGLHALMDQDTVRKETRTVGGKPYKMFYNPMWSLMGDLSDGPSGSYHYLVSKPTCYVWNMFDQVIMRPSLLPRFDDTGLQVLTRFGGNSLAKNGIPDNQAYSDHFPLLFTLLE